MPRWRVTARIGTTGGGPPREWREYYDRAELLEAMGVKEDF
ncbi:MAG TPA: hypothetical protein VM757_04255 [Sphingomicrobium sp.]|nr:hypothetical protein [Sphingomicrobium sp.]